MRGKCYHRALAELFKGNDTVYMLKMREIYRHLSNAADRATSGQPDRRHCGQDDLTYPLIQLPMDRQLSFRLIEESARLIDIPWHCILPEVAFLSLAG